jgi:hypothetical protein
VSERLSEAVTLAAKIETKARDALEPLRREMRIMQWPPEYRVIMWEAVIRKAMAYAAE